MKLSIVFSEGTCRLYGDRGFFALLAKEANRLVESGKDQHAEFQTSELLQPSMEQHSADHYSIHYADDLMSENSYMKLDSEDCDVVLMVIEDFEFEKYK